MLKMDTNKVITSIAVIIVVVGIFIILHPYLKEKKDIVYNSIFSEVYDNEVLSNLDNIQEDTTVPPDAEEDPDVPIKVPDDDIVEDPTVENPKPNPQNDYIGMIQISKINLNRGFVDPKSKYNNIKYNVTIINGSNFPDVKNGNFILAAHSGSGPRAIFKNLYKLEIGDKVNITYKNKKYTYKIVNIYYQKKQGYIAIYRNINKTTLTLVTCTKNNSKSQTVYIAELI